EARHLNRLMKALRCIEGALLGAIMLAMSFAYTLNVAVREFFPSLAPKLAWIEELCLFGLVWMIFLGLALGLEGGRHIGMLMVLAVVLLLAGSEIFLVIGIPAVLAKHIFHPGMPDLIIGQRVVGGVEVIPLLAIPYFVFASDLMARGRMAAQLAELFRALVG